MAKFTPVTIENDQVKELTENVNRQDLKSGYPESQDPNFPMFKFKTLEKHLLYFPDIDLDNQDKDLGMVVDRSNTVAVKLGGSTYGTALRNTQDLRTEFLAKNGISGNSPLQELVELRSTVFNLVKNRKFRENNIDEAYEFDMMEQSDPATQIAKKIFESIPVGKNTPQFYMPVIDIEIEQNKDEIIPVQKDGKIVTKIGWLRLSGNAFEKLEKAIKNSGKRVDGHLKGAGSFYIFDYTSSKINPNSKDARMMSAKDFTISVFGAEQLQAIAPKLDEKAANEGWTLPKLRNTVTASLFLPDAEIEERTSAIKEQLLSTVEFEERLLANPSSEAPKDAVAVGDASATQAIGGTPNTEDAMKNFGIEEATTPNLGGIEL